MIGQSLQKSWVRSQNVLTLTLSSAWESFPGSHDTKGLSRLDDASFLATLELPHDAHRHLCAPTLVLPFFLIDAPQISHFLVANAHPLRQKPTSPAEKLA